MIRTRSKKLALGVRIIAFLSVTLTYTIIASVSNVKVHEDGPVVQFSGKNASIL